VRGHIIQKQDKHSRELIQIGDMLISTIHRVQLKGKWIRPGNYPGALRVTKTCELHNFIVDHLTPIVVNDIVVSTIGTFCEGLHNLKLPNHALWATPHIVEVFRQHPQWPVVELDTAAAGGDNFLQIIKNKEFASEYASTSPLDASSTLKLLMKYGMVGKEINAMFE
jgi:hypothetical protein